MIVIAFRPDFGELSRAAQGQTSSAPQSNSELVVRLAHHHERVEWSNGRSCSYPLNEDRAGENGAIHKFDPLDHLPP